MNQSSIQYDSMSNAAIAAELGNRLEQLRLTKNLTQQALAEEIGITPKSYRQLVAGSGKIENWIAALRVLNALEQLDEFLPSPTPSPLEQLKLQGRKRQRARPKPDMKYKISTSDSTYEVNEPKLDW